MASWTKTGKDEFDRAEARQNRRRTRPPGWNRPVSFCSSPKDSGDPVSFGAFVPRDGMFGDRSTQVDSSETAPMSLWTFLDETSPARCRELAYRGGSWRNSQGAWSRRSLGWVSDWVFKEQVLQGCLSIYMLFICFVCLLFIEI